MHLFHAVFLDFKLQRLAIFMPVEVGERCIPQKKPYYPLFERSFETGRIFVMKGSRQVLVKEVLFHLRGRGHAQGNTTPNFIHHFKSSILGLSNEVSFVLKSF